MSANDLKTTEPDLIKSVWEILCAKTVAFVKNVETVSSLSNVKKTMHEKHKKCSWMLMMNIGLLSCTVVGAPQLHCFTDPGICILASITELQTV